MVSKYCVASRCRNLATHAHCATGRSTRCGNHALDGYVDLRRVHCTYCKFHRKHKGSPCRYHDVEPKPARSRGGLLDFALMPVADSRAPGVVGILVSPPAAEGAPVRIAPSPGKGFGVFTTQDMPAGAAVGRFSGYIVRRPYLAHETRVYAVELDDTVEVRMDDGSVLHEQLDLDPAIPVPGLGGQLDSSFVDCIAVRVNEPGPGQRVNAELVYIQVTNARGSRVSSPAIFLTRRVPADQEVLVYYGKNYRNARNYPSPFAGPSPTPV